MRSGTTEVWVVTWSALAVACGGGGAGAFPADASGETTRVSTDAVVDVGHEADAPRPEGGRSIFGDSEAPGVDSGDGALAPDGSLPHDAQVVDARPDAAGPDDASIDHTVPDAPQDAADTGRDGLSPEATSVDAPVGAGVVLALAGGGSSILAGEFTPAAGWKTTPLPGPDASSALAQTAVSPAVALTSASSALGVITSDGDDSLLFTTWSPSGGFTPLRVVGSGATSTRAPAIVASGGVAYVAFLGPDYKHYMAIWTPPAWTATAEPVTPPGGTQAFGPSPAGVTAIGSDVTLAYAGNDHDLYDQTRQAGVWQPAMAHGVSSQSVQTTPAIAALTGSSDMMIAFVASTTHQIMFTTRSSGSWSTPDAVSSTAFSNLPVALLPLGDGGALLAYQGQDGDVYSSTYSAAPSPSWTTPAALASPGWATPSTPALAPGVGGVQAEMVFIDTSNGAAEHARYGAIWSAPSTVGGVGLAAVGVASM